MHIKCSANETIFISLFFSIMPLPQNLVWHWTPWFPSLTHSELWILHVLLCVASFRAEKSSSLHLCMSSAVSTHSKVCDLKNITEEWIRKQLCHLPFLKFILPRGYQRHWHDYQNMLNEICIYESRQKCNHLKSLA